jgi:hypothetical protein
MMNRLRIIHLFAATRWGYFRRGYYSDEYRAAFQRELFKGYSQKVSFRTGRSIRLTNLVIITNPMSTHRINDTFQNSEVSIESRYARDEVFLKMITNESAWAQINGPLLR